MSEFNLLSFGFGCIRLLFSCMLTYRFSWLYGICVYICIRPHYSKNHLLNHISFFSFTKFMIIIFPTPLLPLQVIVSSQFWSLFYVEHDPSISRTPLNTLTYSHILVYIGLYVCMCMHNPLKSNQLVMIQITLQPIWATSPASLPTAENARLTSIKKLEQLN